MHILLLYVGEKKEGNEIDVYDKVGNFEAGVHYFRISSIIVYEFLGYYQ